MSDPRWSQIKKARHSCGPMLPYGLFQLLWNSPIILIVWFLSTFFWSHPEKSWVGGGTFPGMSPLEKIQSLLLGKDRGDKIRPLPRRSIEATPCSQEHPAQLPLEQPEQPPFDGAELTKRSPDLQPKIENFFSTFSEPQVGQSIRASFPRTNFSKSAPHIRHVYSKIGNESHLLPQNAKKASGGPSPSPPGTFEYRYPSRDVSPTARSPRAG